MTSTKILLASVALGALMVNAAPAAARANKAGSVAASAAEIRELKAMVEQLKARLDAQEAAMQQAQAAQAQTDTTVKDVQATVAKVEETATTAQATATKASSDVSATDKLLGWAKETKISGRMYFNISSVDMKSNGVKTGSTNGVGFSIKRFYLGVDHKFDDVFSANLTTDVSSVAGVGQTLYIKKAYLQAKLDPALVVRLGAADTPWIPFAEGIYGYRHIEQTISDRTRFGTSSDWGVHVLGDFADGMVSYQVSAMDGGGYRNPQFTKTVDLEGRVSLKLQDFIVGVGGYTGKLGKKVQGATTYHTANRLNALVAYKTKTFTVGGEYFHAKNWNRVTSVTGDKSDGFAVFGSVNFAPKWSAFARYDWVKPSKDLNNALKERYFNAGIQFTPAKIVDLALVYKHDKAENGTIATGNGTIGGSIDGSLEEFGLYGQFRF